MANRKCPRCGTPASPKLKFCRDCGGRLDEAPEGSAPPPGPPEATGDETMVSGMAAARAAPGPDPDPEEEEDLPAEDPGDATIIAGMRVPPAGPPAAAPPSAPTPPGGTGDETIMGGFHAPQSPPPEEEDPGETGSTKTFVGTVPPNPAGPPPLPPPPPLSPPIIEDYEPEPVTDDFDLGDDASGGTLLGPPPLSPAPPPPPPPAPPRDAEFSLEHWSPKVKGDVVSLAGEECVVGRDRGDIQYEDDNFLSKKHGRFFRDDEGRLCVEDLGTLNGTYLRVRTPLKLEHRDVLSVGRHVFRFELLTFEEKDDRTMEGDPLTRVQGVQGTTPRARIVKRQEEGFSGIPFFFGTNMYVLGRTDGSHRFTRDDRMSRRHVAVIYREGDYWLEDLGSQNGTFLRLRGPHVLLPGDVIRMGDQYFKYA